MAKTSYAVAIGSNRMHGRYGRPQQIVAAAIEALARQGLSIDRVSSVRSTAALGPAGRSFANAAVILSTKWAPQDLLAVLKRTERDFGRRSGRRWGPRVLDLDILLWSEGRWHGRGLAIPHPGMTSRAFVLDPLAEIAPGWRYPGSSITMRQLAFRQIRRSPTAMS